MKVLLKRIYNCSTYCIGHIYVDGTYVCDTIEDTDRGLDKSWPLSKIVKTKVKSKTAIPTGIYTLTLNIDSPKFSQIEYYENFCKRKLPRLLRVKRQGLGRRVGLDRSYHYHCRRQYRLYNKIFPTMNEEKYFNELWDKSPMGGGRISIYFIRARNNQNRNNHGTK